VEYWGEAVDIEELVVEKKGHVLVGYCMAGWCTVCMDHVVAVHFIEYSPA
jgi:hypothetical protein